MSTTKCPAVGDLVRILPEAVEDGWFGGLAVVTDIDTSWDSLAQEEFQELELEQNQQNDTLREVNGTLAQKIGSHSSDEKMLSETQKTLQQLRVEFERLREQLHLLSSDHKVLGERRSALERTLERIEEQRIGLLTQKKAAQPSQSQNDERFGTMTRDLKILKADLVQYGRKAEELGTILEQHEQAYAEWKEHFPKAEKELVELRNQEANQLVVTGVMTG